MSEAHMHSKFGMRRPRETDVGAGRPSEISPNKNLERPGKGKVTHVKICLGPEGQGKQMLLCRESNFKPRSKFVWVQKAKRNKFE